MGLGSWVSRLLGRTAAQQAEPEAPTIQLKSYPDLRIEVHAKFDRFISAEIAQNGEWEPFETLLVDRMLSPGDVFVDIGANIGWYTIIGAAKVGPAGRVYAFEPEPLNHALAARNIARNGLKNVTLERIAISDARGEAALFLSEDNLGDHRLYQSGDARPSETVPTVTLGEYFAARPGPVRLIKIDAQGSEGKIFAGIPDDFVRRHDVGAFIIEYWPGALFAAGATPEALIAKLKALELQCFVIQEPFKGLDPIDLDVLLRRAYGDLRPETGWFANLLALPSWKPLPDWIPPLVRSPDSFFFYKES